MIPEKISYVAFWFEGLRTEDDVRRTAHDLGSLGYRGMDLKDTCFAVEPEALPAALYHAVRGAEKEGLAVPCAVHLGDHSSPERWESEAEATCRFILAAADAGIGLVNTCVGSLPPRIPGEWWEEPRQDTGRAWDALRNSLERIARTAERAGVTVALESVAGQLAYDYFTTKEMLDLVESGSLCLTMDPSHYLLADNDVPWTVRRLGSRIRHVHLKDAAGRAWAPHITPLMGEGSVDWPNFFRALADIHYDGWYAVEFESWNLAALLTPIEGAKLSYLAAAAVMRRCFPES